MARTRLTASAASRWTVPLALGAAGIWGARRVAYAPPDPGVAARADTAQHSGPWRHGYADVNGIRLHYAEAGSGPLVILLHGFPQCWYEWHYVIPRLASHFRLVAPDMRGYNLSEKPGGVDEYNLEKIACDISGLIVALGEERAHVVGHDWGGSVAWYLATAYANRVDRLVVINAPHPAAYEREIKKPDQMLRSLYVLFFQFPLFPEAALRLGIRSALPATAAVPGAFSSEALDVYANGAAQRGAATAMLNYYRAIARSGPMLFDRSKDVIDRPTLILWGMRDWFLPPRFLDDLDSWFTDLRIARIEECGHWVPEEQPAAVAANLMEFLQR